MARLLPSLPEDVDAVDGYSRHFVGSFSWWRAMERRLCFFRFARTRRWAGAVHEQLAPIGRRIVIPGVWFHYGHVVTPYAEWAKSRLYASLGQPGFVPDDVQMMQPEPAAVWGSLLRDAISYRGPHPALMRPTIAELSSAWNETFRAVDAFVAGRGAGDRIRSAFRAVNYARLLAWRRAEARLAWAWVDPAQRRGPLERSDAIAARPDGSQARPLEAPLPVVRDRATLSS